MKTAKIIKITNKKTYYYLKKRLFKDGTDISLAGVLLDTVYL